MINYLVTLTNEQNEFSVDEIKFKEITGKMLESLATSSEIINLSALNIYNLNNMSLSIDILVCDNSKITELNKAYRGKNEATDVLSFALFADNPENRIIVDNNIFLGEIIISAEMAKQQADENNKSFEEEMCFLLSHGILHLLGFSHDTEETLEFMLKTQEKLILRVLNV
ncbi:MAG: rRNA maturation RNase YbeY [bacterium]